MQADFPRPPAFRPDDRAGRVAALRAAIDAPEPLVLPGMVTALTALQIEYAGFDACYLTGAGVSNVEHGVPDIGLMGLTDMVDQIQRVASATTLPIVVDADTGYGGPLSVYRTVQKYEQAGAAGIQLEDQEMPKRCGHFDRKRIVTTDEMVAKIEAALAARRDDTVIIARTDAIAVEGMEAAMERSRAYRDAGADVLFVEAPKSIEDFKTIVSELSPTPLLVNIVEGGKTPEMDAQALGEIGFAIVLFANTMQRIQAKATADALEVLSRTGSTMSLHDSMIDWKTRQSLVGLDEADALEDHLRGIES